MGVYRDKCADLVYALIITTDALLKAVSDGEQEKAVKKIVKANLKELGITLKELKEMADEFNRT